MDKLEKYEIKLESIGGLGANLIGKLLGEVGAEYYGLQAQSFAEYGSEKRGSPVKSYIRFSKNEIRLNTPITKPDLTAIFSIKLKGKDNLLAGINENSSVVVNSSMDLDRVRDYLQLYAGNLYVIDALKIAREYKTRANVVLLGAIGRASGFLELDSLKWVLEKTIGKKYPDMVQNNINGLVAGYENVSFKHFKPGKYEYIEYKNVKRKWGYDNAPIGGVNTYVGNMVTNDVSGSREGYIPVFDKNKCIHCGLCDSTCPDMSFQFVRNERGVENLGIDYAHCKGCLRCVQVCPTQALICGIEEDYNVSKMTISNIHLINKDFQYTDTGSNSWVESVSSQVNGEY